MTTINFVNQRSYTGNRPYADVVLLTNGTTHKCLVDTGADYLQLPAAVASPSVLAGAISMPVSTVAGTINLQMVKNLKVEIEGYPVVVDVLFDPTNTVMPIAGRQLLLAAFDLGFQTSSWLWT